MPAIRALILDFDGLILETEGACYAAWCAQFAAHGQEYPLEDYLRIVGAHYSVLDPRRLLEQRCGRTFDWEQLDRERLAHERKLGESLVPQPGVVALLEGARARGLRLGVASSSSHNWVDGHLERQNLRSFFNTTVCRGDAPRVKPDPDLYLEALRRLEVQGAEAIAFEDSHNGSLAAKRAGLWCVAVPSPITASQDFAHADLRLDTLAGLDLDALLARFSRS
jgi:HAD superfamily hydrolase (TIGR01509 family)